MDISSKDAGWWLVKPVHAVMMAVGAEAEVVAAHSNAEAAVAAAVVVVAASAAVAAVAAAAVAVVVAVAAGIENNKTADVRRAAFVPFSTGESAASANCRVRIES